MPLFLGRDWPVAFDDVIAGLTLAVSGSGLILSVRSMLRAQDHLGRSPDDRIARFAYGWEGTFALLNGLATSTSPAILLVYQAGPSGLALAGVAIVKLLLQPVALSLCWVGVRKIALGNFGQVAKALPTVVSSSRTSISSCSAFKARTKLIARTSCLHGFGNAGTVTAATPHETAGPLARKIGREPESPSRDNKQWPAVGLEIARIIAYSPARVSVRMDF